MESNRGCPEEIFVQLTFDTLLAATTWEEIIHNLYEDNCASVLISVLQLAIASYLCVILAVLEVICQ